MFRSTANIPYVKVMNNDLAEKVAKRIHSLFTKNAEEL